MAIRYDANTSVILKELYPLVEASLNKSSVKTSYRKLLNEFISVRSERLYDSLPCDKLICVEAEMDKLFDVLHIEKSKVKELISKTYYGEIEHFKPLAAKHEFTVTMMCVIRCFILKGMKKDCDLAMVHLAFSGKFYPSIYHGSYQVVSPDRNVMEYVVNNQLSKKYDLTTYGSVIGAIRSVCNTWQTTYSTRFKKFEDGDIVYLIQQLHSRIGSFTHNIAEEYYKAYEDKDSYIAYSHDSFDAEDFHIADSDILKVERCTEKTINAINSNGVQYNICRMCSTTDITPNECRAVIESIINNRENMSTIRELISLMISLFFSAGEHDVSNISFITYTVAPKPNAKQKEILRMKEIVEDWLCESGTAYMRRRSRLATKNAYERAVKMYFALIIHNANR